jgi:hypothetical protein
MFRHSIHWGIALGLPVLLLAGCGPKTPPPVAPNEPTTIDFSHVPTTNPVGGSQNPNDILQTDPSAARLQDIGGYIMLYYRDHAQMAPSLEDISAMPGGQDLNFTSATGETFIYQPRGMWSPDHGDKCIILYDPAIRDGRQWCLFMTLPKAGAPLNVDVVDLPEPLFLNYRP